MKETSVEPACIPLTFIAAPTSPWSF